MTLPPPHPLGKEERAISATPVGRLKLKSYFMTFPAIGGIEQQLFYQPLPQQRSHLLPLCRLLEGELLLSEVEALFIFVFAGPDLALRPL